VKDLIRRKLTSKLRESIHAFTGALMAEHGKDIQHTKENDPKYNFGVSTSSPGGSNAASGASTPAVGHATTTQSKKVASVVNTTKLTETFEFQTTAAELYTTFVDPQRVAAFTRAPPQIFEPRVGGKFRFFGGNVEGEFVELDEPKSIIQKWRLADWPQGNASLYIDAPSCTCLLTKALGHFSTLNLIFDQGYDMTTLRLTWTGVPVGQDDVTRRNFEE